MLLRGGSNIYQHLGRLLMSPRFGFKITPLQLHSQNISPPGIRLSSSLSLLSFVNDGKKPVQGFRSSYQQQRHHRQYSNHSAAAGSDAFYGFSSNYMKLAGLGASIIVGYYAYKEITQRKKDSSIIHNDTAKHKGSDLVSRTVDEPESKDAETFELGLYIMSQKEIQEAQDEYRNDRLSKGPFYRKWFFTVKFFLDDYVIEPALTTVRFMELALIFVPLLVSYPILVNIGPKQKKWSNNRLGKLYWNKFLRFCIEMAGPCFIKLGQWAASRTDIFSKNLCEELSGLHSNSKPHSFRQTKKIICENFEVDNFEEIFDEFIKKPVGVGSIAQVHVGKLSNKYLAKIDEDVDKIEQQRKLELQKAEDQQQLAPGKLIKSKIENSKKMIADLKEKFSLYKYHNPKPHQWVAIKVMHPHVEVKISRDLKIMRFFANIIDYIPTMEWLSLPEEVEQFTMFMKLQLDLRIEGINLNKFSQNFGQKELKKKYDLINETKLQIKFPKPYLKCSGREVLVEEYMHAIPISVILDLTRHVKDQIEEKQQTGRDATAEKNFMKLNKILSNEILDSFLQMLILDNFIHSDLHPGNIFVRFFKINNDDEELILSPEDNKEVTLDMQTITTELLRIDRNNTKNKNYDKLLLSFSKLYDEGYQPEVCYLDTGLVTELNERDRVNFLELFKALSMFDGFKAGELMVERSRDPESAIDREIFALKTQRLVSTVKDRTFTLGNISIGDLLDKMLSMVRQHHVKMEPDFVNVVVAILLLEGIGRQLDPELDLFARLVWAFIFGIPTSQDITFLK